MPCQLQPQEQLHWATFAGGLGMGLCCGLSWWAVLGQVALSQPCDLFLFTFVVIIPELVSPGQQVAFVQVSSQLQALPVTATPGDRVKDFRPFNCPKTFQP